VVREHLAATIACVMLMRQFLQSTRYGSCICGNWCHV